MWVQSLGGGFSLEKEMAIHCSNLAWRIPWTEEPDWLQSIGLPPPPGRPPLRGQGIPGSRAVSPLPRRELSGALAHSTAGLGRRGRS